MIDTGKRYFIVDFRGQYCKLNEKGNLVIAKNSSEAQLFSIQEANDRINGGKKTRFYSIVEAEQELTVEESILPEKASIAQPTSCFATPTKYDDLNNDWKAMLMSLSYLCEHLADYQMNLSEMLSVVDKEISDLMHYLELYDLQDNEMLNISKMLQDCRRKRRLIKNEMDFTSCMQSSFVNSELGTKVQHGIKLIDRMQERQYSPRVKTNLFDNNLKTYKRSA